MARFYYMISVLMVLVLLAVGTISLLDQDADFSETEGRSLKSFPKITVSSLLDSSFLRQLEAYYADTFPTRETLLESYRILDGFYGLDSLMDNNE